MSLKEDLDKKLKEAMISKNEDLTSLLRMIKSSIKNAEIAKGHELEDAEVIGVLEKEAKQRKDSISQYEAGGRADLAEKEKRELEIISEYLPEQMSEDEIKAIVAKKIAELEGQDFGRIMGACMVELKGKADGSLVQKIVRETMES